MSIETAPVDQATIALRRAKSSQTDGRTLYPRFKQLQLLELFNAVNGQREALVESVVADSKRASKVELEIELVYALKAVKDAVDSTAFAKLLAQEAQNARDSIREKAAGAVLVVVDRTSPIDTLLAPLAAAIVAGNAAVCNLPPSLATYSAFVSSLLGAVLDRATYFFVTSTIDRIAETPDAIVATSRDSATRATAASLAKGSPLTLTPTPVPGRAGTGTVAAIVNTSVKATSYAAIAKEVVRAAFFKSGQATNGVDQVLVHETIFAPFLDALLEAVKETHGVDASLSDDHGRIDSSLERHQLAAALKAATGLKGTQIVHGRLPAGDGTVAPIILAVSGTSQASAVLGELTSLPVLVAVPFSSLEDACALQEKSPGHVAYVFGDKRHTGFFCAELASPSIFVNSIPFDVLVSSSLVSDTAVLSRTTRIYNSPRSAVDLYSPYVPSALAKLRALVPRSGHKLLVKRVAHPPHMRRAFFPQGLFLMAGSIFALSLGTTGWIGWLAFKWIRAARK